MPKIKTYRYDDEEFSDERILEARGDPFEGLTGPQKIIETALREAKEEGAFIRSTSLYTWEDQDLSARMWVHSKKKYLYELEVDEADVRHKGDLNFYSEAVSSAMSGAPFTDAIQSYWRGDNAGSPYTQPRVEILVAQARVIHRLKP